MGERDVDAEFADIIAHWDEVESLPDAPAATSADSARTDPAGETTRSDTAPGDSSGPDASDVARPAPVPADDPPRRVPPNPVNPPPVGPFVVWRGADKPPPSVDAPDVADDPHELFDGDEEHFEPGPTAPL